MMKPKFDDVIEYVKAGEGDPAMEKMLHLHPDGQELLKQARFICKMLQRQSESKGDGGVAANFMDVSVGFDQLRIADSSEVLREPEQRRTFYQSAPKRVRSKRSNSINRMIESAGRNAEGLGRLEFATDGEHVTLTYKPSDAVMDRFGKPRLKYLAAQMDFEGIQMHGLRITLSLPSTLAKNEPVAIRVASSLKNTPARRVDLIFMPDSGPFLRIQTDRDGIAKLPVPDQPGILRIETPIPQLLHIKIKI